MAKETRKSHSSGSKKPSATWSKADRTAVKEFQGIKTSSGRTVARDADSGRFADTPSKGAIRKAVKDYYRG